MNEQVFDASGLMAQAARVAEEAQAERRAAFQQELDAWRAAPGGGAFQSSLPPPVVGGAIPWPPGLVGQIAAYIYEQSPRPVAEVAIVGALGLMAGIAGRCWHIPGSGLNLYIVLVARSAIGKEAMNQGVMKLIQATAASCPEAGSYVDPNEYVSGPALSKACAGNPCFVNLMGEIGHKFRAMAQDRDSSMRSLQKALLTLYDKSGPDAVAGGIAYSNQENNVEAMHSVAFSLIGETTPGTFYESITDAMMQNGFMSRFCVIEYRGDRPARNPAFSQRPPQELIQRILLIVRCAGMAATANVYQEVAFSDSAKALLDRFDYECDDSIRAAGDDENRRQLWNRAHLKALRVAALLAVGDNHISPVISEEHAAWAIDLMRRGNAVFERRILEGDVGEGSDGGRERKVLELCREFLTADKLPNWLKDGETMQRAGIVPRRYLQQRTQRLSAFENYKLGHTVALNMAITTAVKNGALMEVKKEVLVEQFSFHGQAYRVLNLL